MANPEDDFAAENYSVDSEILSNVNRIAHSAIALSPRPPRSERRVTAVKEPGASEKAADVLERTGAFLADLDSVLTQCVSL